MKEWTKPRFWSWLLSVAVETARARSRISRGRRSAGLDTPAWYAELGAIVWCRGRRPDSTRGPALRRMVPRSRYVWLRAARVRRVREARRLASRRHPVGISDDLAGRAVHAANDDALPQPDGDGHRGDDPCAPARRRRAARQLRQDDPCAADGRRQRRRADDHAHWWATPERSIPR